MPAGRGSAGSRGRRRPHRPPRRARCRRRRRPPGRAARAAPSRSPPVHASMNRSLSLLLQRGVDREAARRRLGPQRPARPAGQLAARGGAAPDDGRDLVEGVLEHVVQHERGPFRRAQPFEQGVHRQGDVVDEGDVVRRIEGVRVEGVPASSSGARSGAVAGVRSRSRHSRLVTTTSQPSGSSMRRCRRGPGGRRLPARRPRRPAGRAACERRDRASGAGAPCQSAVNAGSSAPGAVCSVRSIVVPIVPGAGRRQRTGHAFLRMPSCQISFSIDGLALGVATAIVERDVRVVERLAQQAVGQVDPGGEPVGRCESTATP